EQGTDLRLEKARPIQGETNGTPAQGWILLLLSILEIEQDLVAADVDGTEGDGLALRRFNDVAIKSFLRFGAGEGRGHHELQLGAEQSYSGCTRICKMRQVHRKAGID